MVQDPENCKQVIDQAKELLATNLDRHVSLQELSEQLFMSRTRFCVLFKEETGMSVGDYVHYLRIEKAKELLLTDMSIQNIAKELGFKRQGSFSEMFKSQMGCSPSQWRKDHPQDR